MTKTLRSSPRIKALWFTLLCAITALVLASPARAEIEVNVNRGDVQPLPVAVPAFGGAQGADIAQVIAANLQRSGLFRPLDPASFVEKDLTAAVQPRFGDWKTINAQALVNGQVTVEGGRDVLVRVTFQLGVSGQLVGDVVSQIQGARSPVATAGAERAVRAVYAAAPFRGLPREFYGDRVAVNFNAREACAQ